MTDKLDDAIMKRVEEEFIKVQHKWMEEGKLVRGGFAVFSEVFFPKAGQHETVCLNIAFMSGAEYMFTTLMGLMTEDREPTKEDERRLSLINQEMEEFRAHVRKLLQARDEDAKEARAKKEEEKE